MIYFDNAATSKFKPESVLKSTLYTLQNSSNAGRSGHSDSIAASMWIYKTRKVIVNFLSMPNANVVFTKNCTEALNLAILGTVKLGGHVVTTAFEHNSVLRPLKALESDGIISTTIVKPNANNTLTVDDIKNAITPKTYIVVITAMSNVTGYAPPIKEIGDICAKKGILFLVDAAQALGHLEMDMSNFSIDMLAAAGHKGLHAPQGIGFLAFNKKIKINPIMYGGTGTESASLKQPEIPPESLESGTLNLPAICGLYEGVEWTTNHFLKLKNKYKDLAIFIEDQISNLPKLTLHSIKGSGIISFRINGLESGTLADILSEKYDIAVRAGLHCAPLIHQALGTIDTGLVRISIGAVNTHNDAKKLVRAIKEIHKDYMRQNSIN